MDGGKPPDGRQGELPPEKAGSLGRRLARARDLFREGRTEEAKMALADLLDEGQEVREVYVLLANIYRFEGQRDLAEANLRRAREAPPATEVGEGERGAQRVRRVWVGPEAPVLWPVVIGGLPVAVAVAASAAYVPWSLSFLGMELWPLVAAGAAGLLAGSALGASGVIRTWDQELTEEGPDEIMPLWLFLLVAGVFSAFLGAAVYLRAQWVRGEMSLTCAVFLGTVGVLGALLGMGMGGGALFWWIGLSVLWVSVLLGWALGGIASPREWWQS